MAYRHEITGRIAERGLVAILRGIDEEGCLKAVEVLVEEGIDVVEVTLNSPGALGSVAALHRRFGGTALVGAGTVLDEPAAVQALLAGAAFLVSPHLRAEVVAAAHRYGRPAIPGASSATEVVAAAEAGADLIKVFPANSLGASYFRELAGPLDHLPLVATGGVHLGNAASFLEAGAVGVAVSSALVNAGTVRSGAWEGLRETARALRAAVDGARARSGTLAARGTPGHQQE